MTSRLTTQLRPKCCNLAEALVELDSDIELLHELATLFLETLPDRLRELDDAMKENDPRKINEAAHLIKGSVRFFGAHAAYKTAQLLEIISSNGQRTAIDSVCVVLLREIEMLRNELLVATQR